MEAMIHAWRARTARSLVGKRIQTCFAGDDAMVREAIRPSLPIFSIAMCTWLQLHTSNISLPRCKSTSSRLSTLAYAPILFYQGNTIFYKTPLYSQTVASTAKQAQNSNIQSYNNSTFKKVFPIFFLFK